MNYIIIGGTGFIGTHLTILIKQQYPDAQVYNLDIVKPGTPLLTVKNYVSPLKEEQVLQSVFVECDVRKSIEHLTFTPTSEDVIFNFAAVHRTPGHPDQAYFETNMDFLKKDIRDHFINEYPYIETKPKDEPPAKYNRGADVTDSIVGSGAIFDGKVEHSVVFRRVRVGKGAVVRNSILMEGCQIGENCVVENAIFDKEVVLSAGQRVIGVSSEEPAVLKKGTKL